MNAYLPRSQNSLGPIVRTVLALLLFWTGSLKICTQAADGSATNTPARPMRDPTAPSGTLANLLRPNRHAAASGIARVEMQTIGDTNPPPSRIVASAEFSNVTFNEAARAIADATGMNLSASTRAAESRVALYLKNLPAIEILETLCNANGLWFRREPRTEPHSEVIRVFTVAEFRQDLTAFRDEKTKVFTLLYPNTFDISHALQDLFGDRLVINFVDHDAELSDDLIHRFDRFDLVDSRSDTLIGTLNNSQSSSQSSQSSQSSVSSGRSTTAGRFAVAQSARRANPLPQVGTVEGLNADQIQTLESEAASPPSGIGPQSQTARIVEKRVNIFISIIRRQNRIVVRTADERAMEEIGQVITSLDVPTSMVLLEVKVLSIALGDGFNSAFDYTFANGKISSGFSTGTVAPPPGPGNLPGGTGVKSDNFIFQYFSDKFSARLQLLESKNRVTALATPVLLTANREVSKIFVGQYVPFNTSFNGNQVITTGNTTVTGTASTGIQFQPVGTTLLITPSINADRTVTIRMVQDNSSIQSQAANVLVPSSDGFTSQSLDIVQARTVSGTFVAKDREAVVVGGLIDESVRNNTVGVPWISRIPLLGQAFRRDDKGKNRSELVVIIRPYVMNTPSDAEGISQELLKQISIHPNANMQPGDLDTYRYNQVPLGKDANPLSTPR